MVAPRALARSYSSSTTAPAPSASTKPSRSRSQGRLAAVGSSLRVESARAAAKPPMPSGVEPFSAPPATITSAVPSWICWAAKPMLWVPVVQAVTVAKLGPLKPYMMARLPAIMLMMVLGTKNGDSLRGPESISFWWFSSMLVNPPMPEPMATPMRSPFSLSISRPASRRA